MSMLHEPQTSLNRLEGDNTGALGLRQAPLFPRYLGEISPLFRRYRHSLFGARPSAIFGWPDIAGRDSAMAEWHLEMAPWWPELEPALRDLAFRWMRA